MSKAGLKRMKLPLHCPKCGRGCPSLRALRRHAVEKGCDISLVEKVAKDIAADYLRKVLRESQS